MRTTSRQSNQQQGLRAGASKANAPTPSQYEVFAGKTLEELNSEIEALTKHLYKEGVDFSPKVMRVSEEEAGKMVEMANRIMSGDESIIGNPDELTKAKSLFSAMTVFLGEIFIEYESLVAKEWMIGKNKFDTVAETDQYIKTTENYRRMRNLKYKLKGLDKLITSIRDRLTFLSGAEGNKY